MTMQRRQPTSPTWQELMAQQDGVLSRIQGFANGLSEDAWQWQIERGRWQRVLPGVVVGHSGQITDRQRAWAAVLHAGDGAALTGDVALVEHGVKLDRPDVVHIAVPHHRVVRPQTLNTGEDGAERLVPRRVRGLSEWVHPVRRPAVLRVAPAALHAVAWAPTARVGEWRLAAVVQQGRARVGDLRTAVEQMPRLPRLGLIKDVLDDVELGAHAASELDFLDFLRRHALPLPDRLQRPVRSGKLRYLDAWWEKQRVTAEIDGAHHRTAAVWGADTLRGNSVVLVEKHDRVLLLRFTRGNLRHDELVVAAQLRDALL